MERVEFISSIGSIMYVDKSRVDEYLAAGYKLAVDTTATENAHAEEKPKKTRKKLD